MSHCFSISTNGNALDKNINKILEVGCGKRKRSGAVGIDINPSSVADVIHDLNIFPYPFSDEEFNEAYAENVIEHLDDVVTVMEELHRIVKPNGILEITVPHYSHRNAYTDPTHKHFFGLHSFDYFIADTSHSEFQYSSRRFELLSVSFEKNIIKKHYLDRMIVRFANMNKDLYEHRLCSLLPLSQLTFTLLVKK